jgi:hypothetical protein
MMGSLVAGASFGLSELSRNMKAQVTTYHHRGNVKRCAAIPSGLGGGIGRPSWMCGACRRGRFHGRRIMVHDLRLGDRRGRSQTGSSPWMTRTTRLRAQAALPRRSAVIRPSPLAPRPGQASCPGHPTRGREAEKPAGPDDLIVRAAQPQEASAEPWLEVRPGHASSLSSLRDPDKPVVRAIRRLSRSARQAYPHSASVGKR